MTRTTPECWPACPTAPAPSSGLPLCWANPRTVGSSPPMAYGALTSRYPAGGSRVRRLRGADPAIVGGVSDRRDGEIVLELRRLNDDSWTTNVVWNTAPATPPQAQQGWWLDQLIMCANGRLWCACEHPQRSRRAPLWADRVFLWPTRAVPSAIHSAGSSTALAPSALADAPPVASSNWRTTSAASRPRSLTFRPCACAQFRTASLCASEPLLLVSPPPQPARLGARRRLAVALFAPPVRPRVPCPGPRAARCGRTGGAK